MSGPIIHPPTDPAQRALHRYAKGERIPDGSSPRIYLVMNWTRPERQNVLLARSGGNTRLYSYYIIGTEIKDRRPIFAELERCRTLGMHVFLDSGAHSFQNRYRTGGGLVRDGDYEQLKDFTEERETFKQSYIDFCKEEGWRFDLYANFDWIEHSPTVWQLQKELESHGLAPLPSVHGDSGEEWMHRYIDAGYDYLGIGAGHRWGSKTKTRVFLDRVHEIAAKRGVKLHGYGMTSPEHMIHYPWYSLDSSTWLKMSITGWVLVPLLQREGFERVRATRMLEKKYPWVENLMRERGFDISIMQRTDKASAGMAYCERACWNMWMFTHLKNWGLGYDPNAQAWPSLLGDK